MARERSGAAPRHVASSGCRGSGGGNRAGGSGAGRGIPKDRADRRRPNIALQGSTLRASGGRVLAGAEASAGGHRVTSGSRKQCQWRGGGRAVTSAENDDDDADVADGARRVALEQRGTVDGEGKGARGRAAGMAVRRRGDDKAGKAHGGDEAGGGSEGRRVGVNGNGQGRILVTEQQADGCDEGQVMQEQHTAAAVLEGTAEGVRKDGTDEEASRTQAEAAAAAAFPTLALPLLVPLLGTGEDVGRAMCVNREWRHSLTHAVRSFSLRFHPDSLSWRPSFHHPPALSSDLCNPAAVQLPLLDTSPAPLQPPSLRLCANQGCGSCASGSTAWCVGGGGRGGWGERAEAGGNASSSSNSSSSDEYGSGWGKVLSSVVLQCDMPFPCTSLLTPGNSVTSWKHALSRYPNLTSLHLPLLSSPPWSTLTDIHDNSAGSSRYYPLPCDVLVSPAHLSSLLCGLGQLQCSTTLRCVRVEVTVDWHSQHLVRTSTSTSTSSSSSGTHYQHRAPRQHHLLCHHGEPAYPRLFHSRMQKRTVAMEQREVEKGMQGLLHACPNLRALHLHGPDLSCLLSLSPSTLAAFSHLTHLSLPLPGSIPTPILHLSRLASLSLSLCLECPAALASFHRQMLSPGLFRHLSCLSSLSLLALRSPRGPTTSTSSVNVSPSLLDSLQASLRSLTLLLHDADVHAPSASPFASLWTLSRLTHLNTDLSTDSNTNLHSTDSNTNLHSTDFNTLLSAPPPSTASPAPLSPATRLILPRLPTLDPSSPTPHLSLGSLLHLTSLTLTSLTHVPASLTLLSSLNRLDLPWATEDPHGAIRALPCLSHLDCSLQQLHHLLDLGPSPSCQPCFCGIRVRCDCCDCQGSSGGGSSSRSGSGSGSGSMRSDWHSSSRRGESSDGSGSTGSGAAGGTSTHAPFRHCSCLHPSQAPHHRTRGLTSLVLRAHPQLPTTHVHTHSYPSLLHLELHGITSCHWRWGNRAVPPAFSLFPNLHTLTCNPPPDDPHTNHSVSLDLALLPSLTRISGGFALSRADRLLYPSLNTVVFNHGRMVPSVPWEPLLQLRSLRTLILSQSFLLLDSPNPYYWHRDAPPPLHLLTALHTLQMPLPCCKRQRNLPVLTLNWPPHVRCLCLCDSPLTQLPPTVLGCLELEELHLIGWPHLSELPAGLAGLERLRVVRVSGCEEEPTVPVELLPLLRGKRWHFPFTQSMACER
ncbi:unnamed protein product [Closterium sp. NIES-54]